MLTEYNLQEFLQQWLDTGTFPNKQTWKIIVNQAFNQRHRTLRQSRISADPGFSRFLAIFQDKDPAKFSNWRFPTNCYEISQCIIYLQINFGPTLQKPRYMSIMWRHTL